MTAWLSEDELRVAVDRRLAASLDEASARLPDAVPLVTEIRRVVEAGGKRLRPVLCYWGYAAGRGAPGDAIVRAAAALELLHTFAVVHDDIMDSSHERRGVPTINAASGDGAALLAGDLALVLADAELMTSGFDRDVLSEAFGVYSRMRQEVVAGQFLELQLAGGASTSEADARRVAVLKSGRYSVREPLLIGASLARAPDHVVEGLARAGEPLGEAFQLADDLLGTFGDPSATGKPVDSDVRTGKKNVLYAKTAALLAGADREFFLSSWGGGDALTDGDVERLRALVDSSGARAATQSLLDELAGAARDAIDALDVDGDPKAALLNLATRLTDRSA